MKSVSKRKKYDAVILALTIVLFAALMTVTAALFLSFNQNAASKEVPFDLERITSNNTHKDNEELADILIPEFIGFTVNGQRKGISVSARAVSDIYSSFTPIISTVMVPDNARVGTEEEWRGYSEEKESVYIRYHSQFPDIVVGRLADISCSNATDRNRISSYVYELFFIPGDGNERNDIIVTRSKEGNVTVYSADEQYALISSADISKLVMTYGSQLKKFTFAEERYSASSYTEPVFVDAVLTNNIIISNNVSSLIHENMMGVNNIMRVFGINPDKLLSVHSDEGISSYADRSGVFYVYDSAFEYVATDDGGIELQNLVGYTDRLDIGEYIHAAYSVIEDTSLLYSNCTGGYADMYLSDVYSDGRNIKIEFRYSYDNVRITDMEPAFVAHFKDGKLTQARLYTIAVNNTGYRNESRSEWWFFEYLEEQGQIPLNVGLVYRSDFVATEVAAEWSAIVKDQTSSTVR